MAKATGIFLDVVGLAYKYGNVTGTTSSTGEYSYEPGKPVTFAIGNLELGTCLGRNTTTISDLVSIDTATFDSPLVNRARLLFSLTPGQGFEQSITITPAVEATVNRHAASINLDSDQLLDLDGPLAAICAELNVRPKSIPHVRNHLRREAAGFKVMRDFKIPAPDGSFVLGDIYLPLNPKQKYPVLVSCHIYGRRVLWGGPDLDDEQEIHRFESAEDEWHSTAPGTELQLTDLGPWSSSFKAQRGYENIAAFNTFSYVPQGYAMVKIDPRGVSQTPGARWIPTELAKDFFTAVEWCADQPWSNGNIGLVGSSYGANTLWAVASMKPKGLKCFVPYATDIDSYREAAYIGGVPSTRYLENWFARVRGVSPKWKDHVDVEKLMLSNPNHDKMWEMMRTRPEQSLDVPCFVAASQIFMIHGRGAYEAWLARRPENTHLQLVDCDYYSWPSRESAAKIIQFLNHYLKTTECPVPERVGIQVRLGDASWYWRKEKSWPVPGTQYVNWYLDHKQGLSQNRPTETDPETQFSYPSRSPPQGKSGASFHSAPFEEDADMAGHFTAVLNISSTAEDADVNVMLWAVDAAGRVVAYGSHGEPEPLAKGFLRVSHRKTDPSLSLPWRPWHTHKTEDLQPLKGADDVVRVEVEIMPAAARVQKGWSLRLDVLPSDDQPDIPGYTATPMRLWYGENSTSTASDAVHVGGNRLSYITCPIVPKRENYPRCMI
ncbi:Alpha/Beta hydrolase protein [Penicillium malachiteum]|uniref:Alpha/Beta hydrolase protein n=1 Tax=Penicillium malachiteum TaxID=1324776 RepID=A0AAD6HT36_9EURO|nr:Alpha/Beta hydrolase protein [Penicillium malachiteum]